MGSLFGSAEGHGFPVLVAAVLPGENIEREQGPAGDRAGGLVDDQVVAVSRVGTRGGSGMCTRTGMAW